MQARHFLPQVQPATPAAAQESTPACSSLNLLVQQTCEILGMRHAVLALAHGKGDWVRHYGAGLDATQVILAASFHEMVRQGREPTCVRDLSAEADFASHPLVAGEPALRFYAGLPLLWEHDTVCGVLAIMDSSPRTLDRAQHAALELLAQHTMLQLASHPAAAARADIPDSESLLLSMAGEIAKFGGWTAELPSGELTWSKEVAQMWELPHGLTLTAEDSFNFYPPHSRAIAKAAYIACATQGIPADLELEAITFTGRQILVRLLARPVRNAQGSIVRIQGAVQDITESERMALALERSEDRFHHFADSMPHIIWTATPDGQVDYFNVNFAQFTGLELDVKSQNWINAVHPGDRASCIAAWQAALASGSTLSIECRINDHASGAYRWHAVGAKPARDARGQIVKWYGVATDVHDRKASMEKAEMLSERLNDTLESMTDGFLVLDREWRFAFLNSASERIFGRASGELLGKVIWDVFPQTVGTVFQQKCLDAMVKQSTIEIEHYFQPWNRWFSNRIYPGPDGLSIYFQDITERKQTELELAHSNRSLRMLSRCNEAMARIDNEQALLEQVCRIVMDGTDYIGAWVGYAGQDADCLIRVVAHAGISEAVMTSLASAGLSWSESAPFGKGPSATAIRTGKPQAFDNVLEIFTDQLPHPAILQAEGYRSGLCLPLSDKTHTFGVLTLYHSGTRTASDREVMLLQELAGNLAAGVIHIRNEIVQRQTQEAIVQVAARISASSGTAFFEQLARGMAHAVGADAAFITRLLPGTPLSVRTITGVIDERTVENFEYPVEGAPCAVMLESGTHIIPANLMTRFPGLAGMLPADMQGCAGQRLDDAGGQVLGTLFVLFRRKIQQPDFVRSLLQIFAARAAAELERQEKDAHIQYQASLLNKAKDAIIVRDMEHRITFWNKGAERLYEWPAKEVLGKSALELFHPDEADFESIFRRLLRDGEWSGEHTRNRKDGNRLIVEGSWTLVKDEAGRPHSIFSIHTDVTERKAAEQQIQRLAFYDQLTGLPNRQLLRERLHHAMLVSARSKRQGALMFLDLDNFKALNDTQGHATGDLLLQQVAQRLARCVCASDTVGRFGGDEFVVVLEELSGDPLEAATQAELVGEKILALLSQPYRLGTSQHNCTTSIGVTLFDGQLDSIDELLKRSDLAMYQAKTAGRNAIRFYDPAMQAAVSAKLALEADLCNAVQHRDFSLHYQPQFDTTHRIIGVEGLIRWMHPTRGNMSPAAFIPVAEETGLILTLGRWALEAACTQLTEWSKYPETASLTLSVNVSASQFRHPSFVQQVLGVLLESGADPRKLKLELTESMLVNDMEEAVGKMRALRAHGIGFSLDDFGTGYSSLSYLRRLPLEQLKIDRSFIAEITGNANDAVIVRTIIALGKSLGMAVIAEGVETIEQRALLAEYGCTAYQGYLFSRPIPAPEFIGFLRELASQGPSSAQQENTV